MERGDVLDFLLTKDDVLQAMHFVLPSLTLLFIAKKQQRFLNVVRDYNEKHNDSLRVQRLLQPEKNLMEDAEEGRAD